MIINHKYKFIYLKTRKTASTSMEIALSKFCGENDVITPISKEDELKRKELGYRGPQNFIIAPKYYSDWDLIKYKKEGIKKQFFNHAKAVFVKNNIPDFVWDDYFKFTFERNPYDKAISRYHWSTRNQDPRPKISDYLNRAPVYHLSNWNIYSINDHIVMDFVGRYEKLNEQLHYLEDKLNLPEPIELPEAKSSYRKDKKPYQEVLDNRARKRIKTVCAKEISFLKYGWEDRKTVEKKRERDQIIYR